QDGTQALPSRGRVGRGEGTTPPASRQRARLFFRRRLARPIVRRPADTPSPSPFPLEGKGRPVMTLIENFPSRDAWAEAAAARLAEALAAAIAADGRAVFAGAGGSTPSPIYARLAQADLDWANVVATLVDER